MRAVEEEDNEDHDGDDSASLKNALAAAETLEIACGAVELLGAKASAAAAAADADASTSLSKLERLRSAAAASRAAIDDRRAELTAARLARAHEEQYEALRAELSSLPRRGRTAAAREAAGERRVLAESAAARAREALEERRKQVTALLEAARAVAARCDGDMEEFGGGGVTGRRPATPAAVAAAAGNNAAAGNAAATVADNNDGAVANPIEVDNDGEEGEIEEGEAME